MGNENVIIAGSVGLDDVETPFGRRRGALGGSAIFSAWACSYFSPAGLVGVAGNDFPREYMDMLRQRNINTAGLLIKKGKTFRWKGRYGYDFNVAQTLETELNVMSSFSPRLPSEFKNSKYLLLANIDPDVQLKVLDSMTAPCIVGSDTMNFWIENKREKLLKVIERSHILFVNDSEARQLCNEPNLIRASKKILEMGPETLIVKQGEYGAAMFYRSKDKKNMEVFSAPSLPLEKVIDPTGAGDTFAGAFMGYLARCGCGDRNTFRSAVALGSVVASFAVEGFSLENLKKLDREKISCRFKKLRDISCFENIKEKI